MNPTDMHSHRLHDSYSGQSNVFFKVRVMFEVRICLHKIRAKFVTAR